MLGIRFRRTNVGGSLLYSVDELKVNAHIDASESTYDAQIAMNLRAAQTYVEKFLNRSYGTHTVEAYFSEWRDFVDLVFDPINTITSVEYYADDDNTARATLDASNYYKSDARPRVYFDGDLPGLYNRDDAIKMIYVTAVAGDDVEMATNAVRWLATTMFEEKMTIEKAAAMTNIDKYLGQVRNPFQPIGPEFKEQVSSVTISGI